MFTSLGRAQNSSLANNLLTYILTGCNVNYITYVENVIDILINEVYLSSGILLMPPIEAL